MLTSKLDEIRAQQQRRRFVTNICDAEMVDDIGWLLDLADAQQAKLDACGRLAQSWERNAAKIGFSGTTAVMVCVSEMKAVLGND